MPAPKGTAKLVGEIVRGVYRFTMHDNRIDTESDCYVVVVNDRAILIDPLPMDSQALKRLGAVEAICLTASCHERAASRYRRNFKVPIYAPKAAIAFERFMLTRPYLRRASDATMPIRIVRRKTSSRMMSWVGS